MISSLTLLLVGLTAVYADNEKHPVNTGGAPASPTSQFYSVPPAGANAVYTETGKSSHPGQIVGVPVPSTSQFYGGVPQTSQNAIVYTETGKSSHPGHIVGVPAPSTSQFYGGVPQTSQNAIVYTETGKSAQHPGQHAVPVSQTPQFYNVPQGGSYVAVPSVPQPAPYVAVSSVPQPTPYVSSSSASHQAAYVAVPSAPQPAPYVAVSSAHAHQPTTYVGVSPKFNSAPVPVAPAAPAQVVPVTPVVVAAPKYASPAQVKSGILDKDAQIISEGREVNHDGTFDFGFNTENGISVQSKGYIKAGATPTDEPIQVIEGSYQYVDGFGKLQTISYIADENGYRAFGDSIPQPHEAILKALAHRR